VTTGTRNTEALRARRKAALQEKLLGAVEQLHDHGRAYGETSVEQLITTAGVTRSTFYSYFEDKDALLRDLASSVLDELLEQWSVILPGGSREDLRRGIAAIIKAYRPHRAIMVAIDEPVPDGHAAREFERLMERGATAVTEYIKAGQAAGDIPSTLDAVTTSELLMWMTERGLAKMVANSQPRNLDAFADGLTEIFWRTLRGGGST
jgi:TetR/AcrR family transcriptional regulator, ethionamide resistance regulator